MKPSNTEKLIISMLCDLMKQQGSSTGLNPDFIQESVRLGKEWAIVWKYPHIFARSEDVAPNEVIEVFSILNMYLNLQTSFELLDDNEKANVVLGALANDTSVQFPGFDEINESDQAIITRALTEDIGLFDDLHITSKASRTPMLNKYRRQYAEYDKVLDAMTIGGQLNAEGICNVINA